MSASINYGFILTLSSIKRNLFSIGGPILVILGTIGSILSFSIFIQKHLRKNPCSIYFMAYNIASIGVIYGGLLPPVLELGYSIDYSIYNLDICRLRLYAAVSLGCICPSYLILASIDRVFITSPKAHMRRLSSRRYAAIFIITGTLFWLLCSIPIGVFAAILNPAPNYLICLTQTNTYTRTISYGSLAKEILVPSMMVFFGVWAVKNIHHMKLVRIAPTGSLHTTQRKTGTPMIQAKDRQLVVLMLINIIIYVPFSCVLPIVLLYTQLTASQSESIETLQSQDFLFRVATYCVYVPYCINSYAHLFMSKTFRKELKDIILTGRLFPCCA
ncbi:unnamed protein product [Adineta ricciae]|uniref:G-protein coupled receptors family 1 profile domain-containing protein n=1 Tax=Adineta ricciae TaxID=249248 RepID=A0A814YCZ3_ADIRI|nr:unnamed protein product [Adineta ricciae]